MKRVALLGGAFDPITVSHELILSFLLSNKVVDAVWFMPCYTHSYGKKMASFEDRMTMTRMIADKYNAEEEKVKVSDFESTYETGGQTYPTLIKFLETYNSKNDHLFHFIIGLDNALTIDKWDDYEKLINLIPFIVLPRGPDPPKPDSWFLQKPHLYFGDFHDPNDGSSTKVRNSLRESRTSPLIQPEILQYVLEHDLYRN